MSSKTTISPAPLLVSPSTAEASQRILDTAERLFAELGYDAVSISMIAEQADVSKANIFHHFSSKDELYATVLRSACAESTRLLDELVSANGSIAERLTYFAQAHIAHLNKHHHIARLVQRELFEDGACRGKQLAEQVCGENFSRLVGILRDGQARGELRHDRDPAMIANLLVGANVFFFQNRELFRHFPDVDFADDPVRYSQMMVEIILDGIIVRHGDASSNSRS
ncbi:MAG TPA: TetR/AcrR family transcriptional regulator [Gammaproteobacteria bacterium]|nr:TetR/AcrR family transcriptional regulator [Gammaproteobacteria bacterium]